MTTSTIEATAIDLIVTAFNTQDSRWWEELTGQKPIAGKFNIQLAIDSIPRTEYSASVEIARKYDNLLSYVAAENRWYIWNGRIHAPCEGDAIAVMVLQQFYAAEVEALGYVRDYYDLEARKVSASGVDKADEKAKAIRQKYDKGEIRKHKTFRDRVATSSGMAAIISLLKVELGIAPDYFTKDHQWFAVRNGVFDLAEMEKGNVDIQPHHQSRPVTRYFDADWDRDTNLGHWDSFLTSSIPDADTRGLLQKAVGAAFFGERKPRALFNLLGAPASGKSVFLSVFDNLGQGYSVMPSNQAIQQNASDTNYYQDELRGHRFIGFSEVQGKKPLDDGFIKGVMGGDAQTTRRAYGQPTKWYPQGVMFIASNMPLKFDTRDEATFSKVLPIPFPHSFTETDPLHPIDRDLESKIMEDRSRVLTYVIVGMWDYMTKGRSLAPTAAVLAAMDGNKTANSSALTFIEALMNGGYVVQDLGAPLSTCLQVTQTYNMFRSWADLNGVRNVPGKQTFSSDIADFYHGKQKSNGIRFTGLALPPEHQATLTNEIYTARLLQDL